MAKSVVSGGTGHGQLQRLRRFLVVASSADLVGVLFSFVGIIVILPPPELVTTDSFRRDYVTISL
jgi:hypothetical protein